MKIVVLSVAVLLKAFQEGMKLMARNDDDCFDRLSSRYSVAICIVFSLFVSGGQYFGDPITCWTPAEFSSQWSQASEQNCWIKNTYKVNITASTLPDHSERQGLEISYYQWVPIILAFQAFLFTIPGIMWKVFSSGGGYDIHQIVTLCRKEDNLNPEKRDEVVAYLTSHLDRLLGYRREHRNKGMARYRQAAAEKCCMVGKRYGNYLFILYMVTKLFYIGMALFQLLCLNTIIGADYSVYGIDVLADLLANGEWKESPMFPRVTFCDFEKRALGQNVHNYTVQCVLPWNLFNEKIYIVLWWWLVIVVAFSIIGFLAWSMSLLPNSNRRFVCKYLKVMNRLNSEQDMELKLVNEFTYTYLRRDGVFVLRMIAVQVNDLSTAEVVCALWDRFVSYRAKSVEELPSFKEV